jgi:glyoxylase-like metal-dependent hydrolase (beta-lactamase superfamily II)
MARLPFLFLTILILACSATRTGPDAADNRNKVYTSPDGTEVVHHLRPGIIDGVYLLEQDSSFLLIDTGVYSVRPQLLEALAEAGCTPDNLKAIILTHGHWDHTGSAAYLQRTFKAPVLMHMRDVSMAVSGEVPTKTRKYRPFMVRLLAPLFLVIYHKTITDQREHFEQFVPDIIVEDEDVDLGPDGFDVTVISIPGHSSGSIGVLTGSGSFFAGDILVNYRNKPGFNANMADESFADLDRSIDRVKGLAIRQVFPGHGMPFPWEAMGKR